jgi:hypothetical protein
LVIFFSRLTYLLRIGVVGEAGHYRPVFTAQHDHARITNQV